MAEKQLIFLAIAVLSRFTPWFSLLKTKHQGDDLAKFRYSSEVCVRQKLHTRQPKIVDFAKSTKIGCEHCNLSVYL